MKNLTIKRQVTGCNLTADQWELFSDMKGCDDAVKALNAAVLEACNGGNTIERAHQIVRKVQSKYGKYGEIPGKTVLTSLTANIFPEASASASYTCALGQVPAGLRGSRDLDHRISAPSSPAKLVFRPKGIPYSNEDSKEKIW